MPNLTPKNLYIGNGSAANVYTAGSNVGDYTIIKNINFCNANTTTAKTITLYIVPSGNSPVESNLYLSNVLIPASSVMQIDSSVVLNQGANIHIVHNGNITTIISGVEYK